MTSFTRLRMDEQNQTGAIYQHIRQLEEKQQFLNEKFDISDFKSWTAHMRPGILN